MDELFPQEPDKQAQFSQQYRRNLQRWLKVIGRHKYDNFEADLGFLRWAFRKSRGKLHKADYEYFDKQLGKHFGQVFRRKLRAIKALQQGKS